MQAVHDRLYEDLDLDGGKGSVHAGTNAGFATTAPASAVINAVFRATSLLC
jgi:hypothetical protein